MAKSLPAALKAHQFKKGADGQVKGTEGDLAKGKPAAKSPATPSTHHGGNIGSAQAIHTFGNHKAK
jgi:hypothetical protein